MTFEEWIEQDANGYQEYEHGYLTAKRAWDAAWDEQQRVIDEMHLAFRDRVLVPKEPTEAMVEEGEIAYVHGGTIEAVYKAIIQAAQEEE